MELRNDADVEGNSRVVICHSKTPQRKCSQVLLLGSEHYLKRLTYEYSICSVCLFVCMQFAPVHKTFQGQIQS